MYFFFKPEFVQKDYALNSDVFCARVCEFVVIMIVYNLHQVFYHLSKMFPIISDAW